ncbi:inner nuclear membrane protein enriched at telomere/subtelomere region [Marasmius crinis-equi]|uniref:Inner nuclear membrane protein enriched at telomere/subtelomere region n=1 Tax=Marasmius crinis-equi TaxID=585013 RepID=A0ABR3F0D5_9AGAR
MSRLSAAQVIALGEYLEPDFEPSTLTISQLLGVLGYHNIVYPTPYSKPKLVQVFNEQVKRRASKFKKERIRKENSIASDDGITDGVTGEPLNRRKARPSTTDLLGASTNTTVRRSSRRLSRAPSEDEETSPVRPEPPKRRRSSAQPRLGGSSKQTTRPIEPPVVEESEPEEEELPIRKVGRTKKASDVSGEQNRRVSLAEDSGWEDNNIFQSGAESSSPVRPSPTRPKARRSSAVPRKSRKSMSAPPQASPQREQDYNPPPLSPSRSRFEPDIPTFRTPASTRTSGRSSFVPTPPSPPKPALPAQASPLQFDEDLVHEDEAPVHALDTLDEANEEPQLESANHADPEEEEAEEEEEEEEKSDRNEEAELDNKQVVAIQKRIAEGGRPISPPAVDPALLDDVKPMPLLIRLIIYALVALASYTGYQHKIENASIGYCDAGADTNARLEQLKSQRAAIESCNAENRTFLHPNDPDSPPCPPLPILPFVHTCTPCPEHAVCSGHALACEKPYILKPPFPFSFLLPSSTDPTNVNISLSASALSEIRPEEMAWKIISELTDGLPGLGSVGVVPSCVEDPRRKKHIGVLGKGIERALALERGTRLCHSESEGPVKDVDGAEARRWGIPLKKLQKRFRPEGQVVNYDDIFQEAVQQLVQWGGVTIGEDSEGERYLAHKSPLLTWDCQIKVKSREVWEEWRLTVFGTLGLLVFILLSRSRRARRQLDNQRVAGLAQVALDTLRHQEFSYHVDPVSVPQPYLSSVQLRDLVLQEEHDVKVRKRLWEKVERVVEGNANVRANEEEVTGGDHMRAWRWVGATGLPTGTPNTPLRLQSSGSPASETPQEF